MNAARIALAALADPAGVWREKDGGTIRIHHCGGALCASILTVQPRLDPVTGRPRTDKNNEDAAKRNRPLAGIPVLIRMRPESAGKWIGQLYDSDRGKIFSGNLIELDPKTIRIEGCALGICGGEELNRLR